MIMLKLLLESRNSTKTSVTQQVESLVVTECMGSQHRKLTQLGFLARFVCMECGTASCSMFGFKGRCNDTLEGKAILFRSSTGFKCSSGLREKVLIQESLSKLFNLYSLPKPNSTQKSVWTDGGKGCHFIQLHTVDILSVIL